MITVSDFLKTWKHADGQTIPLCVLYDISITDAITLRLSQGDPSGTGSVVYQGNTYGAAAIQIEDDEQTIEGDLRERRLGVSNIDGIAGGYMELNELEGRTVTITTVPLSTLDPADAIVETYTIQTQSYNRQVASVTLGHAHLSKRKVPWRRFERHRCQHDWHSRYIHENGCGWPSDYFGPDKRQSFTIGATTDGEQKRRHGWYTLNALKADAFEVDSATFPDLLYVESAEQNVSWSGEFRDGPFAYRLISGDFDVFTEVSVFDDRSGSLSGILCQEAAAGFDSFVLLGVGRNQNDEAVVRLTASIMGVQLEDSDTAITGNALLRMARVGNVFTIYHAPSIDVMAPTVGWTQLAQKTYALDSSVRLGLALSASSSQQERVAVGFQYFRFNAGGPALCNQSFEQCSEYGNTARFFGMRGIPKR